MFRPCAFWKQSHPTDRRRVSRSHTRGSISGSREVSPGARGLNRPTSKTSAPMAATWRSIAILLRLFIRTPLTDCRIPADNPYTASLYRVGVILSRCEGEMPGHGVVTSIDQQARLDAKLRRELGDVVLRA